MEKFVLPPVFFFRVKHSKASVAVERHPSRGGGGRGGGINAPESDQL